MNAVAEETRRLRRQAEQARRIMHAAVARYLGMDLLSDGSVRVPGWDRSRPTVGMVAPFGPVAHNLQLLRLDAARTVDFYQAYSRACRHLGRRAKSFEGQIEAFTQAAVVVPCEAPVGLRRVA